MPAAPVLQAFFVPPEDAADRDNHNKTGADECAERKGGDRMKPRKLTEEVLPEVIRRLARYESPRAIARSLKEKYGIEISRQGIEWYDPAKRGSRKCNDEWTALFREERAKVLEGIPNIGFADRAVRLQALDRLAHVSISAGNTREARVVLEQMSREVGGLIKRAPSRALPDRDPGDTPPEAADAPLAPALTPPWLPEPSNQPQVDAFHSAADLVLYGGAAGGGKTDLLLGLALTAHERSVIFRRAYVDLAGIEQRLIEILGSRAGYNGQDMVLRRPGRLIEFGALERPGSEFSWQGRPHDFIGFDEGAQLAESKVRFVMGWLRSTTPGQRCRVVIASNPPIGGEGEWLMTWFAPWLDPVFSHPAKPGELRWRCMRADGTFAWVEGPGTHAIDGEQLDALSCTFVPARLDDNRFLRDTGYRAQIMAMPEPLRSKLLKGDFIAGREDAAQQVIPSAWIKAAQDRWRPDGGCALKMTTLGVDVAQGGADETVLAPLFVTWFGELVRRRGFDTTNGPAVARLVIEHMRDRCQVNVDLTGGWGGSSRDHLVAQGITVEPIVFSAASAERTRDAQLEFHNMRAQLWWKFREALDPLQGDGIALPPDRRLAAQLAAPTWKLRGQAIVIESKDEIRKRLGSSTDDADAVVLAWHGRAEALRRQMRPRLNPGIAMGQGGGLGWMGH
jgi:hypothetical protein